MTIPTWKQAPQNGEPAMCNHGPAKGRLFVLLSSSTVPLSIPHFPTGASYFASTILIFDGSKEVCAVTIS